MKLNFWKKEEVSFVGEVPDGAMLVSHHEESITDIGKSGMAEQDNIYFKLSRWLVILGLLLTPFFFLPYSSNALEINKQIFLLFVSGIAVVAWLLGVVSSGWLNWRKNPVDWAVLGIVLSTVITTLFSTAKLKSLFGYNVSLSSSLFSIFILGIFYFVVTNSFNDKGARIKSFFGLSLIITFLMGLLQLLGIYVFGFAFAQSKAFNTIGTVNALGFVAAVALPFFSRLTFDVSWMKKLYLEKVGVVLTLAILAIVNWWALWLVAICGMVGIIVFETMAGGKFKMVKIVLPMAVIVLGVFLMIVNVSFGALSRGLPVEVSPSYSLSKSVALSVLKEKPIWGYGPENFVLAYDKFGSPRVSDTVLSGNRFFDATSEFFNIIVQQGLLGLLAVGLYLFTLFKIVKRFAYQAAQNQEEAKQDVGILSALAALTVGMFLYPFNITLYFLLFALIAIASVSLWKEEMRHFNIEERASLSLVSSLGFIAGLILVLVGSYFGGTNYLADVRYAKALTQQENEKAAAMVVEAINLNGQDDRFYRAGSQVAINLLSAAVNAPANSTPDREAKIQNYTQTAINLARRATEIAPYDSTNWANLGITYQNLVALVDGADQLAQDAFLKAADLRPGDASYHNRIGSVYLAKYEILRAIATRTRNQNDLQRLGSEAASSLQKSEQAFKKAIEVSNNFGSAIYNLGAVYDRQGKVNEAITELEKILPANANQPGLLFELGLLSYRANKKDRAFEYLQRAVLLSPNYSNARWYLGLIYEERGDIPKAIEQLEKIQSVESNKNNTAVNNKLANLRAGIVANPPNVIDQQPIQ